MYKTLLLTGLRKKELTSLTAGQLDLDERVPFIVLDAAEIPKRDERGRTVDVHALRHSFGTLLSRGGVSPRTAQAAMRHSSLDLTMNVYTDPKLLDVHGALDMLPASHSMVGYVSKSELPDHPLT